MTNEQTVSICSFVFRSILRFRGFLKGNGIKQIQELDSKLVKISVENSHPYKSNGW